MFSYKFYKMKTAYRPLLVATFVLFLSLLSCRKDSINERGKAYFDLPFELSIDKTVKVIKDSKEISISLISVNDGRCPTNSACIDIGGVDVQLRLSDNSGSEAFTKLCLGRCSDSDTKQVILSNISYSLKLIKVEPYPITNVPQEKKALLLISRL